MSRTKEIDYRRVTISLPVILVDRLKIETDKGHMSGFIADAVEDKLNDSDNNDNSDDLIESLRKFRATVKPKTKKSSLEILREIRYGGKY